MVSAVFNGWSKFYLAVQLTIGCWTPAIWQGGRTLVVQVSPFILPALLLLLCFVLLLTIHHSKPYF